MVRVERVGRKEARLTRLAVSSSRQHRNRMHLTPIGSIGALRPALAASASLIAPGSSVAQPLPMFSLPARDIADLQILADPQPAPLSAVVAPLPATARPAPLQIPQPSSVVPQPSPKLPAPPPPPKPAKSKENKKDKKKEPNKAPADEEEEELDYADMIRGPAVPQAPRQRKEKQKPAPLPAPPTPKMDDRRSRKERDRAVYMGQPSNWQEEDVKKYQLEVLSLWGHYIKALTCAIYRSSIFKELWRSLTNQQFSRR